MKKLMIAAAAAAMVSGVFAAHDYVYDYCASLKTTKVKTGSQTTTYTVNCGMTADGTYWWDDLGLGFTDAKTAKKYVNGLSNELKRELATGFAADGEPSTTYGEFNLGFDEDYFNAEIADGVKAKYIGATNYPQAEEYDSNGNPKTWCFSFTYKVTDTDCYRVAGSKKITDTIYVDGDCCESTNWEFDDECKIDYQLFFRFGGVTLAKSTKVEVVASWVRDDGYDTTDIGRQQEEFCVAGQGTWSGKLYKIDDRDVGGVKSISGNIVGILVNPGCKDCCNYPVDALCFTCDGLAVEATEQTDTGYKYAPEVYGMTGTAAYGTWSIKFNKSKTLK